MWCKRHGFNPWVGKIPWSRKCQFTPLFLPGKSYGQRNWAGYSPQSPKESNTTECARVCMPMHTHTHTHTHTRKLHPERKRRNKYGGKRTTSTILTEVFYFNFSPLSCFATHLHPLPGWKHFTLDLLKYFLLIAVIQWALHFPFYYLGICLTSLTMF